MIFEPIGRGDLERVAAITNGAYRGQDGATGWTHEGHLVAGDRTTPDELAADLAANPEALILGARESGGGPVLGSVWLNPDGADDWYLGLLAVSLEGQARGLGKQLMAEAEAWAARAGARRMRLTVIHLRDDLIAWYERRGYRRTGTDEPFPPQYVTLQPGLRLLHMEKPLG